MNECAISPSGSHEWHDVGDEYPHVPQDICIWCGETRDADGIRTYASNRTVWMEWEA